MTDETRREWHTRAANAKMDLSQLYRLSWWLRSGEFTYQERQELAMLSVQAETALEKLTNKYAEISRLHGSL